MANETRVNKKDKAVKGNKKNGRRAGNIRSALVMVCVSVAMLSTATYAWFTVTSNPSVEGLKLTAATKDGLEISWDESTWSNSIDINDQPSGQTKTDTLTPVTVTDEKPTFKEPGSVSGSVVQDSELVDAPTDDAVLYKDYVAKYTYYIRSSGSGQVSVGLAKNDSSDNGCFIRRKDAHTATDEAEEAIRVGFKVGGTWVIYEPNHGSDSSSNSYLPHASGTSYPVGTKVTQDTSGSFSGGSGGNSAELFKVGSSSTKVEMYIWIEGTDRSCVNGIMTDELEGRIQFKSL